MKALFSFSVVAVIVVIIAFGVFLSKDAAGVYLSSLPVTERHSERMTRIKEGGFTDEQEDLPQLSSLSENGVYSRGFTEGDLSDAEAVMFSLGFSSREEVLSFLSDAPLISLASPLSTEQLAELFCLIVDFSEEAFGVEGRLEKLYFRREGESLLVRAQADMSLNFLTKLLGTDLLPARAEVSLLIPFCIKNSEITAYYEEILFCFDGCSLPEIMLSFGSDTTGGECGTKRFFADAVGNVIGNACFSG